MVDTIRSFEHIAQEHLSKLYDLSESREITRQLLEEVLDCSRTHLLLLDKDTLLSPLEAGRLERMLHELSEGSPLQYTLGYALFAGQRIQVAPGVLIPRPETEELIELILQHPESQASQRLLDVGTGSGCIAHALTALLPEVSESFAIEVSSEAIPIAQRNFDTLREETGRLVTLWKKDLFALVEEHTPPSIPFDLIVSNPPYIHPDEAMEMTPQVLLHEPHLALFAPEASPIAYYLALGALIQQGYLSSGGSLWVELNPLYAHETEEALHKILGPEHCSTQLIDDLSGKERFLHLVYYA